MQLAVYVTGHGYGHLTRSMAIVNSLKRHHPDVAIHIRAPFAEERVRDALSVEPDSLRNVRLDIGLVALDSIRTDRRASLKQLAFHYGPEGDKRVEEEARWLEATSIDAALLDIPPRGFEACARAGVPAYGSSNFSWDDIWRSLEQDDSDFGPFAERAAEAYSTARLLFRHPMALGMEAFPRVEDVPFVARRSALSRADAKAAIGLEQETRPVVLLAYGGEGLNGVTLPGGELMARYCFVATEPMADPGEGFLYLPDRAVRGRGLRYTDIVRAADVVMTKPGYSTVAEAIANNAALVMTDRDDFIEGPVINRYVLEHVPSALISNRDLFGGHWGPALDTLTARMPFAPNTIPVNGAEVVAERLLEDIKAS